MIDFLKVGLFVTCIIMSYREHHSYKKTKDLNYRVLSMMWMIMGLLIRCQ